MEIKAKLYPYPVLSSYSNDYRNSAFETKIEVIHEGNEWRVEFFAELTSESLLSCIRNGAAKYVYHLECAQTGFRFVIQTDRVRQTYTLPNDSVNGTLEICPLVVAVEDIPAYHGEDFHEDYQGLSFDIEAGCVMAVGQTVRFDITKDIDDLANTPSIFTISKNPDADCKDMLVDIFQRKIVIKLPAGDFYSYKALSATPAAQPILNALTVVPALLFVLDELRALSIRERSENEDTLWYRVLKKILLEQFDCNVESEAFNTMDFLELSQKLVNHPMTEALTFLASDLGAVGGDEL